MNSRLALALIALGHVDRLPGPPVPSQALPEPSSGAAAPAGPAVEISAAIRALAATWSDRRAESRLETAPYRD